MIAQFKGLDRIPCSQFHDSINNNLRQLIRLLERYCGDIELISYGLAPNPNGFCYEKIESINKITGNDEQELNKLLNSLSTKQEHEIYCLYF